MLHPITVEARRSSRRGVELQIVVTRFTWWDDRVRDATQSTRARIPWNFYKGVITPRCDIDIPRNYTAGFLIMRIIDSIVRTRQEGRAPGGVGRAQRSDSYRSKVYNPFSRSLLHCASSSQHHHRLRPTFALKPTPPFFAQAHVYTLGSISCRPRIHPPLPPFVQSLSTHSQLPRATSSTNIPNMLAIGM